MTSSAVTSIPEASSDSDGLKSKMLEVAIHMFASKGFAGTSTREVVEAAGCTKPALYYHFENKAGLFRAAVALAHKRLDDADDPSMDGGFRECLLRSLDRMAAHVTSNPDDLRLLFRAQNYSAIDTELIDTRPLRAAHVAMVVELLEAGIAAGEVRSDLPVEDAAISLVGMLHFELQLWLDGRPLADDFAERIVSIYMDGVAQ